MEAVLEKPKHKQRKKKPKESVAKSDKSISKSDEEAITDPVQPSTSAQEEVELEQQTTNSANETGSNNANETVLKGVECMEIVEKKIEKSQESEKPIARTESKNENSFDKILLVNKELMSTLKLSEIEMEAKHNEEVVAQNKKESVKYQIRAYTEGQLAALYTNNELQAINEFSTQFIEAELKGIAVKRHILYDLLEKYLQARNKLVGNSLEIEQLRQEYKETHNQIWSLDSATVSGRGECHDGITVTATHSYKKAVFHRSMFQTVGRILTSLRKVVTETHVLYSYLTEVSRLQIEVYLQNLVSDCLNASGVQPNAPVSLILHNIPPHLSPILSELRLCISVLFAFQRRVIRDTQFLKETREWLNRLVAILLRLANWQDHLFLVNHILRCPAGVGSWAAGYIQTPLPDRLSDSPFSCYEINHLIAVLSAILQPIQKREQFLDQFAQSRDNPEDCLWVIVDSEGEEDEEISGTSLRENDLVQLLNQLPLDNLFRLTLLIQRKNDEDFYNAEQINEHHLLRFLALCTILMKITRQGLLAYDQPRYHQFSKRLSRFIRHIVQYVTDQWEHFSKVKKLEDAAMLERLQVEYDAFFLRATHYLYTSQRMGAWQFLAVVPYHMVSMKSLWKIFYLLHDADNTSEIVLEPVDMTNFQERWRKLPRSQFEERLNSLDDSESYYLLNAFANMALARNETDMDFIRVVVADLMQIGYISEATQETCSKNARILLAHITSKYPDLLSDILKSIAKDFSQVGELALYLFEELPLSIWIPSDRDIELISSWLTQSEITTNESRLARMILSRLNWSLTLEGPLFLPYCLHIKVAMLLAKIVDNEVGYLPWAWQTAFRLRLHINDKGFSDLNRIPELENVNLISKGVREQKPFFCFLGLLTTTHGHLVPLVCTKGLLLLENLQLNQKYDAILFSLHLIVPLFLNCQESLINCEKFQNVLIALVNADRTYVNMAKSLVAPQNPVLEQFGNMITFQIQNYKWYDLETPRCLIRLWMNSLVSIPNWNKDIGVLTLLDVILKGAFFYADALDAAVNILRDLLQCATPQEHNTSISSLFKWASQSNLPQGTLLTTTSLPTCVWLAYILISLEHEEREKQTGLWKEILVQLKNQKGKVNVDAAIKKAASVVKVSSFTSSSLCIYRWAQQALDTPIDHPLLPLLWQKFFTLYLVRVPVASSVDKGCLGEKFFDGIINLSFLKRLKKRLQESVELYQKKTEDCNCDEGIDPKKQFYDYCHRVFRAFSLWLEEPRLQEANLYLPNLPPQYEPRLLALIIQGSTAPWLECVDYETVKLEEQKALKTWRTSVYREKTNVNQPLPNPGGGMESEDPAERIVRRLASYDTPKSPPAIVKAAPVIPPIDLKNSAIKILEPHFNTLKQFAHNHNLGVSEHKALDSTYKELVPQLYRSVLCKIRKQVVCKGTGSTVCTGAAAITLQMQEARINERTDHQIQTNRNNYELLLSKSLQTPSQALCVSSVTVQKAIDTLHARMKSTPGFSEMGVELFYYVLGLINEEINFYLPTKQFLVSILEKLGQNFICGVEEESVRLLDKTLKEAALVNLLVPHFCPVNVGTTNFLHMYATICGDVGQRYDIAFSLLSKFDILHWLTSKQPKLSQRTQFIELIIKGLTILGFDPPPEALQLHETYRKHLLCIFEYQFPEHYGDVFTALLKASGSDTGSVSTNVWLDIFNSLSKPIKFKFNVPLRENLRQYAQQQRILNYQELLETARLLAAHFSNERLQYGLYGLYPKYRDYMDAFILLMGMTGHALIISSLNTHQGVLGDKLCEIIWPYLRDMFAPWLIPYWMQNIKENMAAWMQQLTDDRAALLPWIPADGPSAQKTVHMLFECVQFIIHTLPASHCILSYVWQWYVTSFAHSTVKDHIVNVIHASFLALPWNNFWPSVTDLELMLKVVEQYLPECHVFLGHVFMEINWVNWVCHLSNNASPPVILRMHQCILNLLVKLSNEPNVRTNHTDKVRALLVHAECFNWSIIEPAMYQQIMDWYVMSCDPLVLFVTDPMNLDFRILHFLKRVASYDRILEGVLPNVLLKRHIFVRSYVKLLSVLTSRHKSVVSSKMKDLCAVVSCNLVHMEAVVKTKEELVVLMEEMLLILNIESIKNDVTGCFNQWLSTKSVDDLVLQIFFFTAGNSVTDCNILAALYETAINSYFFNESENTVISWQQLASLIKPPVLRHAQLEQVLIGQGKFLTLHALLVQKVTLCHDSFSLLNTVLRWLNEMKISASEEDKVPLFWSQMLQLALIHCNVDQTSAASVLYKFSQLLLQASTEKGISGWGKGLLGAIGIVKQDSISLKFRFLCRSLAGFILAQLPEAKGAPQTVRVLPNANGTVGQPGGNTECAKVLLGLDFGQSQGEIKTCAEIALKQIQDSNNSLHNSRKFLALLVTQLYLKPYLKDIDKY